LEKAQLNIEMLTIIFEMLLIESPEKLSIRNQLRFNNDYKEICEFFPQLTGPPDSSSAEIEKVANNYF